MPRRTKYRVRIALVTDCTHALLTYTIRTYKCPRSRFQKRTSSSLSSSARRCACLRARLVCSALRCVEMDGNERDPLLEKYIPLKVRRDGVGSASYTPPVQVVTRHHNTVTRLAHGYVPVQADASGTEPGDDCLARPAQSSSSASSDVGIRVAQPAHRPAGT